MAGREAIDRAIDNVSAKQPPTIQIAQVTLPILAEAVELPPDGGIRFNQLAESAQQPRVLLLDLNTGAWQIIMLPAGNWVLEPASEEPSKPKLWTPT